MTGWFKAGSSRGSPPVVAPGETVELQVYDDAGNQQGTILLGVRKILARPKSGVILEAMFLAAADLYYHWWMNDSGDAPSKDEGIYHLCGTSTKDCPPISKYPTMVHGDRYRNLGTQVLSSKQVPWLQDKAIYDGYMFSLGKFDAYLKSVHGLPKGAPKPLADAEWEDDRHPSGEGEGEPGSSEESESEDEDMKGRIKKLRAELKKAEDDAAERRKGKKKSRPDRGLAAGSGKDKKKREPRTREVDRVRHRGRSPRDQSPEGEQRKKRKKGRRHKSRSKERGRRASSPAKQGRTDHPEESGDYEDASPQELFHSKRGVDVKIKESEQDRGPFGGGPPVKFKEKDDTGSSSSESSFRKGPSSTAKSSQQRWLAYSNRHPGRLASRMLLKMEQATARGVEGPNHTEGNRTPAVAMNHVLTILLPSLGQKAGLRSTRELKTLGSILDLLARGAPSKAADVVAQRIKAVERASHESHWGSAQFLELLPPENSMLLDKDEEMFVAKEYLLEQKLRDYDRRGGQRREVAEGKGKSKGAKGKTKDRDKGDRGTWDKTEKPNKKPESK